MEDAADRRRKNHRATRGPANRDSSLHTEVHRLYKSQQGQTLFRLSTALYAAYSFVCSRRCT